MHLTLSRFVHALRSADVAVSPAETLDALAVLQQVGVDNRRLLQDALRLTLAKTVEEKAAFDACFPAFFSGLPVREPPKRRLIGQVSREELQQAVAALAHAPLRDAVAFALNGDFTRLSRQVASLFDRGELDAMRHLRDKPVLVDKAAHALGLGLLAGLGGQGGAQGSAAMHLRQYLTGQLKAYVDLQYRLVVDASGQRALLAAALSANFQQLPPDYHVEMERVVCKLADRLARRHRRRRHDTQRGQLDLRRMLRRNVAYDGTPVNVYWRRRRREPATILLVCDVSNSVSQLARFLLLLLYRLGEALPSVRSFAFSNTLGEVTSLFRDKDHHTAVETALVRHGRGTTDYGRAMQDLRDLLGTSLNRQTVLIFLGDARGNYFPARAEILANLSRQAGQTWWLTPETADRWTTGDCLLQEYAPHCRQVLTCNKLADLERFADRLLKLTSR